MVLLTKSKLNSIEALISKVSIDSFINDNEFILSKSYVTIIWWYERRN